MAAWTKDKDRHQLMHALQAAGVPAGAVQSAEDTNDHDPQIASRGCSSTWTIR
jgi:crotonobetainyl-CoA:carnitine CoA-transferase CaiB-like acyl-CoA transferase